MISNLYLFNSPFLKYLRLKLLFAPLVFNNLYINAALLPFFESPLHLHNGQIFYFEVVETLLKSAAIHLGIIFINVLARLVQDVVVELNQESLEEVPVLVKHIAHQLLQGELLQVLYLETVYVLGVVRTDLALYTHVVVITYVNVGLVVHSFE